MKRIGWCLVLAALAGGCLTHPTASNVTRKAGPPLPAVSPAIAATPARPTPEVVTPELVTRENAHAQCDALWAELDRDEVGTGSPAAADKGGRK
jgi:hypothetical protein